VSEPSDSIIVTPGGAVAAALASALATVDASTGASRRRPTKTIEEGGAPFERCRRSRVSPRRTQATESIVHVGQHQFVEPLEIRRLRD
jgi:hypothetical protein